MRGREVGGVSTLTQRTTVTAFRHVERVLDPDRLCKLTTEALSRFASKLRGEGMTEANLACVLRHLRAALAWAKRMKLLAQMPDMERPRAGSSKGRPITAEEFDRMLAVAPKVRPLDYSEWIRYLTTLWLSGLRCAESLILSWDGDATFAVDLRGKRPAFRIAAEAQKARRDETLPMTPDFAQWLLATFPEAGRTGLVFYLTTPSGRAMSGQQVGQVIERIGRKAGVIVATVEKRKLVAGKLVASTVKKFATAHDLRRSFGTRWASRVKPAVLQQLMRHSDIGTTMKYYVRLDADDVAKDLWERFGGEAGNTAAPGNTFGNIRPENLENSRVSWGL